MKKFLYLLIFLFVVLTKGSSQKCGTPEVDTSQFHLLPWYDNNDMLEDFLDSIGYPPANIGSRIVGAPTVKFWIPVQFWVYRGGIMNWGPTAREFQILLDDLNRRYNQVNNTWIGFYMKCDPIYFNGTPNTNVSLINAWSLMGTNKDQSAFNVHIIDEFAGNTVGYARPLVNAAMVTEDAYFSNAQDSDLSHEIGHILGLHHTHQFSSLDIKCFTESVSRTRTWNLFSLCMNKFSSSKVCETTGDALRDTQADNDLISNQSCNYNVTFGNDPWGDSYDNPPAGLQDRPNVHNIMSYNTTPNCVDEFSRLQVAVMLRTLYKDNNYPGWANPIFTFDSFEPDNNREFERTIVIGEVQQRNFHQQWNGPDPNTQCDVDWVTFTPTCSQTINITTSAIPGRTNANTRLTLFNNAMVQLAQNDNISSNDLFSNISYTFTSGQVYHIRIENMQSLVTGYYNLQVGPSFSVTGADNPCANGGNQYSLSQTPLPGSTVTWSILPNNGSITLSPNGSTVTLNLANAIPGSYTLTANINGTCYAGSVEKQITISTPSPIGIILSNEDPLCINERAPRGIKDVWVANQVPGAVYEWRVNGILRGTNSPFLSIIHSHCVVGTNTVTCRIYACGAWSAEVSNEFEAMWCEDDFFRLSPNPTTGNIIVDSKSGKPIEQIRIKDKLGNTKLSQKLAKGTTKTSIDISNLPADIYFLEMFDGKMWHSRKVMKN